MAGYRALCLVALAAIGLCACDRERSSPNDVLLVGLTDEPRSLDPSVTTSLNDNRITANIFDGLVRFREGTLELEPSLAESWTISDDGLTYTFRLRSGVRFHDGTVFDASSVRFTFERMLREDHPEHDTGPFPLAFFFSSIETIESPDPRTVIFHLSEPFAPLLSNLASPTGFIVSPSAVDHYGREFGRHPVGTGAFVFEEWESHRLVKVRQNSNYWDEAPRLETVIFRPLTDENARLTELLTGGCDVVVEIAPDIVTYFRRKPGFRVLEAEGPNLWFLILNMREGPFRDLRMRHAVNMAINREAIVRDLLQDTATVASGPIPNAFHWAASAKPYPYDPAAARKLIEEAGHEGAKITLYATEGGSGMLAPRQMATAIQADLARVGLDVRIEIFEWNTYLARVNAGLDGKADMAEMAWMVNDPETLPYLALRRNAWPDKGGFNSGYYDNPKVDELLAEARRTPDRDARGKILREVDQIVRDDAPWVFVASWKQNAVESDRVHGLELQPSFLLLLKNTWKSDP